MQMPSNMLGYFKDSEKSNSQIRLIHYVTWELISVGVILSFFYAQYSLWGIIVIIGIAIALGLFNIWILHRTRNIGLCSHFLTLIIFLTIAITNYFIWGIGPLHSQWFYVMPLLAASLTGMRGLFIYSIVSLVLVIGSGGFLIPPYYTLTSYQFINVIEILNHFFAFTVIVTTLAHLIHENQRYEQKLNNKNHLLQAEKERYHYLARFDHLTNLPNRRYFIQHLQELIRSLPGTHCITVFFLDLDNFKLVNDQYGHNMGDKLLLETSKRLKFCFREHDFIARLGGDEFTAIVVHIPNKKIPQIIAQRIMHEFQHEFVLENQITYKYSVSVGLATYPNDAVAAAELIMKADKAMYEAKKIKGSSHSPP